MKVKMIITSDRVEKALRIAREQLGVDYQNVHYLLSDAVRAISVADKSERKAWERIMRVLAYEKGESL